MNPKFRYRAEGVTLSYLRTFPGCPRAIPSGQRCQKPTGLKSGLVDAPVQVPQAVGFPLPVGRQHPHTVCSQRLSRGGREERGFFWANFTLEICARLPWPLLFVLFGNQHSLFESCFCIYPMPQMPF